ncbi:MAG: 30S ribosomal protein S13 [Candidatus Aenigmarchaeota archaeon]|nr:30S ribosomal protein S13 [Candidatus Aenigmarchaeota archaeon]
MTEKKIEKDEKKQEMNEIVRLLGNDLNGKKKIKNSLTKVKGIDSTMANVFCKKQGIDPNKITGALTKNEIEKLEEIIKTPEKFNIPEYLLNFRRDPKTGENHHYITAELEIKTKQIIDSMKKLGSYRGIRHRKKLPVRGQRTRSSFRKSSIVGVSKRKAAKK